MQGQVFELKKRAVDGRPVWFPLGSITANVRTP